MFNFNYFSNINTYIINSVIKLGKGKCCFKIRDIDRGNDRGSVVDTYSTLSESFINSGSVITDNVYEVIEEFDYDYDE